MCFSAKSPGANGLIPMRSEAICHFHTRVIVRRRKAWFPLHMSRKIFAAKHSWTALRLSRPLFVGSYFVGHVVGSRPMKKKEKFASNDKVHYGIMCKYSSVRLCGGYTGSFFELMLLHNTVFCHVGWITESP